MNANPAIHALNGEETLFALTDEKGNMIGSGTREACEVLLYILQRCHTQPSAETSRRPATPKKANIRSAIAI